MLATKANVGSFFQMQMTIIFFNDISPQFKFHCKLVPVLYQEHEYGVDFNGKILCATF